MGARILGCTIAQIVRVATWSGAAGTHGGVASSPSRPDSLPFPSKTPQLLLSVGSPADMLYWIEAHSGNPATSGRWGEGGTLGSLPQHGSRIEMPWQRSVLQAMRLLLA